MDNPPGRESTDTLWAAMAADGSVRARAVRADVLCQDAVSRHALSPLAAHALARGLVCAALLPLSDKDDKTASLQWAGGGPLKSVFCEARPAEKSEDGVLLRGTVKEPQAEAWAVDPRGARIGRALMPGVVRILRQSRSGAVSQGEAELVSGELDEDLEQLFLLSEQVPTRARVAVVLDEAGRIVSARGVLVQALPGTSAEQFDAVVCTVTPGAAPDALLRAALGADCIMQEQRPLRFSCPCSRERAFAGVALVGHDDIVDMIVREGGTTVRCEMCGSVYRFSADDLLPLVEGATGDA